MMWKFHRGYAVIDLDYYDIERFALETERDFVFSVEGLSVCVHCGYQCISHAVKTL